MLGQTLQIEDITTGRDKVRLWRAIDAAAALSVCGHKLRYKKQEIPSQSRVEHVWFCDSNIGAAHDLLLRAAIPTGPESLLVRSPEHPFLAALFAIRSLKTLDAWFSNPAAVPVAVKPSASGRLCCLQSSVLCPPSSDLLPLLWATAKPQHDVTITADTSAAFCAAAAVCGFLPYPRLTGTTAPVVHFANESLTFPGLTLPHFHKPQLPGTPAAGAHPFSFALTAALKWQSLRNRQETERRKTFLFRNKTTARAAVIDSLIMDESNGEAADAREQIEEHLAAA